MSLTKWIGFAIFLVIVWEVFGRSEWLKMKRRQLRENLDEVERDAGLTAPGTVVMGPMAANMTINP